MQLDDAPRIGSYRLLLKLGQGAMGDVHVALAEGPVGFAKLSVLKVLRRHLCDDPDFVAMFLEEGRLSMRLAHPNIVQTYEVGSHAGCPFLAMEYLEGQTLAAVLNRLGRDNPTFGFTAQAHVLIEALAAMEYAHEYLDYDGSPLAIVHRDLSPPNIFITYDGRIKVLDFGIAKALDSSVETKTGLILGKTSYMAPEQARGRELDARADLYAIGVMLWEAIAGRRRWEGTAEAQIILRLAGDEMVELPGAGARGLPARLEDIVERALAPDPADRYPDARSFREDLESAVDGLGPRTDSRTLGRTLVKTFQTERDRTLAAIEHMLASYAPASRRTNPSVASRAIEQRPSLASLAPKRSEETSLAPHTTGALRIRAVSQRSRKLLLATALGSIGVGALLLALNAYQMPAPPSAATSEVTRGKIKLELEAFPHQATLWLDGARLAGNPAAIEHVTDDRLHEVRAELEGFVSVSRLIRLQSDTTISLDLKPVPVAPIEPEAGTSAPSRPVKESRKTERNSEVRDTESARPAVPGSSESSKPTRAPSIKLDVENPW